MENKVTADYLDEEGCLHCGICGKRKQMKVSLMGFEHVVSCLCECEVKARQELDEKMQREEAQRQLYQRKSVGLRERRFWEWKFENDNESNQKILIARQYVENWTNMKRKNVGLLLMGPVGTGKSFFAGCIANALLEQGERVMMTNFSRILNEMTSYQADKNQIIQNLVDYPLLIIDDLGIERNSEFALEQVYNVIDSRCESEVMLTMQRKELLKKSAIRHAEYYGMVEVQDALYADSANKKIFTDLISIIGSDANIKMAYRNLKSNKGSNTPGVDGKTFKDLAEMSEEALVRCVRDKILNYQPKAVRRVYIPKPNGKMRPLGIPTVIDRIVQQSVLQVMEPICEAKFYRHSYGFRPNRSTKNAVAVCYKLAQVDGFHYVVDVDIKGFFDNVDHGKLLKQIWTLGIRDKRLISLIGKMLKAPIEENGVRTVPDKGTPQGGVLSPLLANIVLNELDWWIASQWEEMPAKHPLKSDIYMNKNGTPNKGNLYKKLRQSRLKECHIVRYADDFKIFCKSYSDAVKLKHAVEQWLMDRLKLETSPDKSRITNLTKGYSDFLGIKFKLYKKGKKWSIKSHMTDKAINSQQAKLKNAMAQACKSHESEQSQHDDLIRYNQAVIGMHQYYNMATMINADVHRLFPSIDITMKTRLNSRADLSKERPPTLKGAMDEYFYQKYGESKQVRYINGMIVVPVAYCRTQNPMFFQVDTNRYTPQGRERIHRMLAKSKYGETLLKLSRDNDTKHSIEFCDNRLSRFVASKGKCELSKVSLAFEDVECIYLNPPSQGGTDEYANLRIVHKDIKRLIYSTDVKIIKSLIDLFDCRAPAKIAKLNKWRAKAGLEAVNLITINQTLK